VTATGLRVRELWIGVCVPESTDPVRRDFRARIANSAITATRATPPTTPPMMAYVVVSLPPLEPPDGGAVSAACIEMPEVASGSLIAPLTTDWVVLDVAVSSRRRLPGIVWGIASSTARELLSPPMYVQLVRSRPFRVFCTSSRRQIAAFCTFRQNRSMMSRKRSGT
jgi:hypothetical protein